MGCYTPGTMASSNTKLITQNKKARHDYNLEDRFEAGIVLQGTEVKSLRDGRANLRDAFAGFKGQELYLMGAHISPYTQGNVHNHEPVRDRKLLLHKRELRRLEGKVRSSGYTLIPTKMYFKDGRAKVEIALAKGKTKYDKRRDLAKKDAERQIERAWADRNR